jgi:hypothetical protein
VQADFENKAMTVLCHRFVLMSRSGTGPPNGRTHEASKSCQVSPGVDRPIQSVFAEYDQLNYVSRDRKQCKAFSLSGTRRLPSAPSGRIFFIRHKDSLYHQISMAPPAGQQTCFYPGNRCSRPACAGSAYNNHGGAGVVQNRIDHHVRARCR